MNDGRPTGWPPTERQDQQAAIDADVMRLRTVHRAAADLRRGIPVLLLGGIAVEGRRRLARRKAPPASEPPAPAAS